MPSVRIHTDATLKDAQLSSGVQQLSLAIVRHVVNENGHVKAAMDPLDLHWSVKIAQNTTSTPKTLNDAATKRARKERKAKRKAKEVKAKGEKIRLQFGGVQETGLGWQGDDVIEPQDRGWNTLTESDIINSRNVDTFVKQESFVAAKADTNDVSAVSVVMKTSPKLKKNTQLLLAKSLTKELGHSETGSPMGFVKQDVLTCVNDVTGVFTSTSGILLESERKDAAQEKLRFHFSVELRKSALDPLMHFAAPTQLDIKSPCEPMDKVKVLHVSVYNDVVSLMGRDQYDRLSGKINDVKEFQLVNLQENYTGSEFMQAMRLLCERLYWILDCGVAILITWQPPEDQIENIANCLRKKRFEDYGDSYDDEALDGSSVLTELLPSIQSFANVFRMSRSQLNHQSDATQQLEGDALRHETMWQLNPTNWYYMELDKNVPCYFYAPYMHDSVQFKFSGHGETVPQLDGDLIGCPAEEYATVATEIAIQERYLNIANMADAEELIKTFHSSLPPRN